MTHSAWPAKPFPRRAIFWERVSLHPRVELSKTEWISFQIVRPEDFCVHSSVAVHIDLWFMTQSATLQGAPLEENFRAWPRSQR
jgi:hypothetical protein